MDRHTTGPGKSLILALYSLLPTLVLGSSSVRIQIPSLTIKINCPISADSTRYMGLKIFITALVVLFSSTSFGQRVDLLIGSSANTETDGICV